jgi:hypothetical protein
VIRSFLLALALAAAACDYSPPGECKTDGDCSVGTSCSGSVCTSCPGGVCGVTVTVGSAGGTINFYPEPYSTGTQVSVSVGANTVPDNTTMAMAGHTCASLPPSPTGGTCLVTFDLAASGVTTFSRPVRINGNGVGAEKPSTVLVVARIEGNEWVDVITAIVGGGGTFKTLHATAQLPGILKPGTYVVYQPAAGSPEALFVADFGIALVPDDGNGQSSGLRIVSLYDDDGFPLAKPTISTLAMNGGDLDGSALTPDGSEGVLVDGSNFVVFFSGVGSGFPLLSSATIDVSKYGGDGDSIVIMPDGNEAVVSADGTALVVITGIATGQATLASSFSLTSPRDGLVIANDGRAMLARGFDGLNVFAITPVTPAPGPLGGTVYHDYTAIKAFTTEVSSPAGEDGRDGMAFSPADGTRAVVVGQMAGPQIQLFTGLPGSSANPPVLSAPLPITGAAFAFSVTITTDGTRAIVGTDAGLVLFNGVDTGTLVQVGPPFDPSFTSGGTSYPLSKAGVPTLGVTLDGAFVVAMTGSPDASNGTLLMFPIQSNGFGAAVGTVSGIPVPANDQMMMH